VRLPWWYRPVDDDEPRTIGEPGEGRVLVVTRRDAHGDAVERSWVSPEAAAHWREDLWH